MCGSQGMLFDITERKQAEAELSYERDLLRERCWITPPTQFISRTPSPDYLKAGKVLAKG